jgi:hypothetical protein
MSTADRTRLETFTENDLPDLDEVVLGALDFLENAEYPELAITSHKQPLVVGSGNALQIGKLLFRGTTAQFAEEGEAVAKMNEVSCDALYIISASGMKHAISLAEKGVVSEIPTYLITANPESPARTIVGPERTYVFPHIREPYTYNTSTYLSMLFGMHEESPREIADYITTHVAPLLTAPFEKFDAFLFTVPVEFGPIRKMFETKFDELFGPYVLGRAFTIEEMKHAKTVVTAPTQCFISLGEPCDIGRPGERITIPLPKGTGPATLMAIGYYIIGKIQKAHLPYFKNNIESYTKEASQFFGHEITIIAE